MRALDCKLVRDLWRLRGQVFAVAMVIGSGVAVMVMSLSSMEALEETATAYYERYRFADVFAEVKRAPERLVDRIAAIPGVQAVDTQIVRLATLDVAGFKEPVIGRLVSVPERGEPVLNRYVIRAGRSVRPGAKDEVMLSEPFAEAHGLHPGGSLKAIINGKKRTLRIVGIALSPEFVYAIGPGGLMPDDKRYGILWMGRDALAAAYDLKGAFNAVAVSLLRGARAADVIDRLDRLLARYGGIGAYGRDEQISNWFLMNEIEELKNVATILPSIFLAVAAFLTNMVMARLIATERSEIGLMKAFGYRDIEVGWHYAKMVIGISGLGIALGWAGGAWLGRFNTEIYANFYRFPFLYFEPSPWSFLVAGAVSMIAALLGVTGAVRRAVRLSPAEAMRPPAPPLYKKGRVAATRLGRWFDQATRIILRQIVRWPLRSFLTAIGVALTVAVLITSMQWLDAIDYEVNEHFFDAERHDVTVGLVEARSGDAIREFEKMPGVLAAEPMRTVPAKFQAGLRTHRGAIQGVPNDARLHPIYDVSGRIIPAPPEGLVLSKVLAKKLGVSRGELVTVRILEGRRPVLRLPVADLFETYFGTPAYMDIRALDRALRERSTMGYANLLVDRSSEARLFARLKEIPTVSSVTLRRAAVDTFYETLGETLMIYVSFFIAFSCTLAFGVVYNSVRISLSERGRELATLRVLGFSRAEISYILLGEVMLLIFAGLPIGCLVGFGLAAMMTSAFETELYRIPLVIDASTYGAAMLIALAATFGSAAAVRRRINRLDLIAVLKTRE